MVQAIYLPLDERPCNYDFPKQLARMTNIWLKLPPRSYLGDKKTAANAQYVMEWLKTEVTGCSHALISIDMLLYGGIVPSRLHSLTIEELEKRINILIQLKRDNPELLLYSFHLITRAPAYSSSEEEPDYYADYGVELNQYGVFLDKQARGVLTNEEEEKFVNLQNTIPQSVFADFYNRRKINQTMNQYSLKLVEEGIIDYLVIPLDDNAQYGYTAMEQKQLVKQIQERRLLNKVIIYPGADEIGCTMFSKLFCEVNHYHPLVHTRYSSSAGRSIIPKYEDRTLNESIKYHITAAGAYLSSDFEEPDICLMVHSPAVGGYLMGETMDDSDDKHHTYYSEVNIHEFAGAIERFAAQGRTVALGDVAYCNGGDHVLMQLLAQTGRLESLDCYAAWNTSGNSLGTVIAHAVICSYLKRHYTPQDELSMLSKAFLYYRLIEDWGYQALVRQEITDQDLPAWEASYFELAHVQDKVEKRIEEKLRQFIEEYMPKQAELTVSHLSLPWRRMFEIGFQLQLRSTR